MVSYGFDPHVAAGLIAAKIWCHFCQLCGSVPTTYSSRRYLSIPSRAKRGLFTSKSAPFFYMEFNYCMYTKLQAIYMLHSYSKWISCHTVDLLETIRAISILPSYVYNSATYTTNRLLLHISLYGHALI